jgi:hypothetical protein
MPSKSIQMGFRQISNSSLIIVRKSYHFLRDSIVKDIAKDQKKCGNHLGLDVIKG